MTPLEQWVAVVQALLARGYSTMNADEAANAAYPGLWQAANAEVARQVGPGPVSKAQPRLRLPPRRRR
jgi:hypothetical protein